ncbi:2-keto-3-deoxy-D-arabino-heptulosonate-7-phosphate synthase [Liquorilactobacillus sucicola DSM 21376 = JCM 15457]|uniref:3-deoxy-7-phosphoheptulonate synthase n=1 Tax=Liquorilactobacillus sucicola DSM 21376 = JCM 15457 TaxID=1423806 RepID=A0A023CY89_9LACO|nr:3-deoxy-7-phosphoheptulonate synthase [Liquorilactobacillus sucicola]KRN06995.1 3-deoxy-7-phosphoheptulonate synthase [Liquorilactobacillus sucicola DSM 21376 = JCM 15457]GAJ26480.1 2-keto-3-deoxy-D-arabino-heptulosonate-7-phosphate synthase [Liquorilactobacillus sucicola DSM 21376 = JCM 15457]
MIIVFNKNKAEEGIAELRKKFNGQKQIFVNNNRVAVQGADENELPTNILETVEEVITNVPAAVQGSRLFHPQDTVIHTPHAVIGGNEFVMMAGPCSVESEEHVKKMARVAKKGGAKIVRGGAFKPRTSPYSFQGLGEEGLKYLREAADENEMDMITEVMDDEHVEMVAKYTDIFQIGARNMQNFSLLKTVGKTNIPVALKRGMSATIDDLLNAAEYIASEGNRQIMLLERGIRTFDNKYTRNTFDLGAVPVLQKLTHYPVIVDPSHAVGEWDLVTPMALAGTASGASGMIVEIHDEPDKALSDGPQALKPKTYLKMAQKVFEVHQVINNK